MDTRAVAEPDIPEMTPSTPTVVLVDDHPLWRETLSQVIERQGVGRVIGEVEDGTSAVEAIREIGPEVVIMDVELPGIDGVAATERIVEALPGVRVLFLSSFDDRSKVLGAVEAGGSGYLLKTAGAQEIAEAVRRVAAGELVFPPHLADVLLAEIRTRGRAADSPQADRSGAEEGVRFVREGEFWTLDFEGAMARVAHINGLADLAVLLALPGREVLAAELVAAREGRGPGGDARAGREEGLHLNAGRGAGPGLDAAAKRAYRTRMEDLQGEIDEAEELGDDERAARSREELQLLTEELARAVGLGGRDRPVASDVERARIAVTRGIRRAIRRIEEAHPTLGRHLDRSVRTGTFCCYDPDRPVKWELA